MAARLGRGRGAANGADRRTLAVDADAATVKPMPRPPRALLLVWLATAAVFGAALAGDYVDDDLDLLRASPSFAGIGHLGDAVTSPFWGYGLGYWRPLTSAVLCVGHALGNGHPWPTHLAALLAHLVATTLLFAIVRRLGAEVRFAALAAGLFALHPCQVESVAWVAALGDPLAGAATLLAVWGWLAWRERGGAKLPFVAWLGVLLALAAKESGVVALAWLAAADVATWRRWPMAAGRWWRGWAGVGALLLLWLLLRIAVFGDGGAGFDRGRLLLTNDGLALRTFLAASFTALPSGWLDVTPYRWIPPTTDALWAALPLRALAVGCAVAVVTVAARRQRAMAWFAGLGFAASIAPAVLAPASLGPWPLVDRYLYTALAAFAAVLLGTGAVRPWLGVVLVAVCAATSAVAVPQWRDHATVVARALADCPRHPEPHFLAGNLARETAERTPPGPARAAACRAAVAAYERARRRLQQPLHAAAHLTRVLGASVETGIVLTRLQGQLAPPAVLARDLDLLVRRFPDDVTVHLARGIVAAIGGDTVTAEAAWLRALELQPFEPQATFNLGRLYFETGRRDAARERFLQTLAMQPENEAARAYLQQLGR